MPARVLSFPFRLGPDGRLATVEQGTDTEVDELIAVALYTRPGERILAPGFGTADPVFVGFEAGTLQRHVLDFGPPVNIDAVTVERTQDAAGSRERVLVQWSRREAT